MLRQLLEYCFPKTFQQIRDEIYQSYYDLGVRRLTRFHKLELPTVPMMEGVIYKETELKVTTEAYIEDCHCTQLLESAKRHANT